VIEAQIIADSINPVGDRITTWMITVPRYLMYQIYSHRNLSKLSSSVRNESTTKIINKIQSNPVLSPESNNVPWLEARDLAIEQASKMLALGMTKSTINRILEPWIYDKVLLTGTNWKNFWARQHDKHSPLEFRELAKMMNKKYIDSTPISKQMDEWHIPYGQTEKDIKYSVAKIVRELFFQSELINLKAYDYLLIKENYCIFEHLNKCLPNSTFVGNFNGWLQKRLLLEHPTEYMRAV